MGACAHVCVCVCGRVHTCVCVGGCVRVNLSVNLCACTCICVFCVCVCVCVFVLVLQALDALCCDHGHIDFSASSKGIQPSESDITEDIVTLSPSSNGGSS